MACKYVVRMIILQNMKILQLKDYGWVFFFPSESSKLFKRKIPSIYGENIFSWLWRRKKNLPFNYILPWKYLIALHSINNTDVIQSSVQFLFGVFQEMNIYIPHRLWLHVCRSPVPQFPSYVISSFEGRHYIVLMDCHWHLAHRRHSGMLSEWIYECLSVPVAFNM